MARGKRSLEARWEPLEPWEESLLLELEPWSVDGSARDRTRASQDAAKWKHWACNNPPACFARVYSIKRSSNNNKKRERLKIENAKQ